MGGPHQGVEKIPHCYTGFWCKILDKLGDRIMYDAWLQDILAPAEYFRERDNEKEYDWYV